MPKVGIASAGRKHKHKFMGYGVAITPDPEDGHAHKAPEKDDGVSTSFNGDPLHNHPIIAGEDSNGEET